VGGYIDIFAILHHHLIATAALRYSYWPAKVWCFGVGFHDWQSLCYTVS
jgi:hypothetical protein